MATNVPRGGLFPVHTSGPGRLGWQARWIEPIQEDVTPEAEMALEDVFAGKGIASSASPEERLHPCPLLKRGFALRDSVVARATLSMSALGVYRTTINGSVVGDAVLAPGFTSYDKIIDYQTYDVTSLLDQENVWGIVLADGWYAGRTSVQGGSCQFGNRLSVIGQIDVEYADGSSQVICTGPEFLSSFGKYVYSDLGIGEKQDLRLLNEEWDRSLETVGWKPALVTSRGTSRLVSQRAPLIRRRERLAAGRCWEEGSSVIIDFGQVIAGRVRIHAFLGEGQEITLEHSEVLDGDGRFFMNIVGRNKDQEDIFIGRGRDEVLEPDFTFHGFRYVRLSGWCGTFDPSCAEAVVIRSDLRETGEMVTSDARVNRLIENILWSQRGNSLSIPTDCPQRERMGWTGDAQVFAPTASFFMDVDSFLSSWLESVVADQLPDGQVLDYSPAPKDISSAAEYLGSSSSAGWGDAIVLVPWTLYQRYGDRAVLGRCYGAMRRWHGFCVESAAGDKSGDDRYVFDTKFNYGDWMMPSFMIGEDAKGPVVSSTATKDAASTAFLAEQSTVLAKVARVLGHEAEAEEYESYAQLVRRAFADRFSDGNGALSPGFQGIYVLALAFDMLPAEQRQASADRLATLVRENGCRLDTGFLSVPYLLDVLGAWGYEDLAEEVFFQDECPSWLYEVDRGATTMWESWAGIQPDGTVGPFSFNHCAFGCVGDWLVRRVGGLSVREPGFREFDVSPIFLERLDSCRVSFESPFGRIAIAWERRASSKRLSVEVPPGSKAHITLDCQHEEIVRGEGSYVFTW